MSGEIQLPPHGRVPELPVSLACRWCGDMTPHSVLATLGARCSRCFEAYCREPQPAPKWMADKRADGPRGWAHALRRAEQAGEHLTNAQRSAWREALKNEPEAALQRMADNARELGLEY